jgi:uncharacterized PurR-regulated membrane protein YhhQ (DUF165 family)
MRSLDRKLLIGVVVAGVLGFLAGQTTKVDASNRLPRDDARPTFLKVSVASTALVLYANTQHIDKFTIAPNGNAAIVCAGASYMLTPTSTKKFMEHIDITDCSD